MIPDILSSSFCPGDTVAVYTSDKEDCRKTDNQPWISKEIKEGIKLKEKAYKVAKIRGTLEEWENFQGQQKAMEKAKKKSEMDYERKLAQNIKTDRKCFYK